MLEFLLDGGWPMFPVAAVGLVLVYSTARYATDRKVARLRLVGVLSVALLFFATQGLLIDAAATLKAVAQEHAGRKHLLLEGFLESTRPAVLGLSLWWVGLVLVAAGIYRTGVRELRAAMGQ